MHENEKSHFRCRECGYTMVQVRVEDAPCSREDLFCPNCLGQLPPRDGKFVLQYRMSEGA